MFIAYTLDDIVYPVFDLVIKVLKRLFRRLYNRLFIQQYSRMLVWLVAIRVRCLLFGDVD